MWAFQWSAAPVAEDCPLAVSTAAWQCLGLELPGGRQVSVLWVWLALCVGVLIGLVLAWLGRLVTVLASRRIAFALRVQDGDRSFALACEWSAEGQPALPPIERRHGALA